MQLQHAGRPLIPQNIILRLALYIILRVMPGGLRITTVNGVLLRPMELLLFPLNMTHTKTSISKTKILFL